MILRILLASCSFLALFGIVELIYAKFHISKELSRKLVHILAAVIIAVLPVWLSYSEVAIVAGLFVPVLYISKSYNIFKAIHTGERSTLGEIYYPFAIVIVCLLNPGLFAYLFTVLVLGISDGMAAIIGKHYAKKHFSLIGSHKSYLGSAVFFISSIVIGITLLIVLHSFSLIHLAVIIAISAALTIIEASTSKGLDNLIVPLASLLFLWLAGLY